jgi:hypothetical protein
MHVALSALLLSTFLGLLLLGLARVLHDMLARDLPPLAIPRPESDQGS